MKKLEDVKFTKEGVKKHIRTYDYNFKNTLEANPLLFHYHLYRNIGEALYKEENKFAVLVSVPKRAAIQAVCDFAADTQTLMLAFDHLEAYPDAQKMLWHYLTGNGDKVIVNTERVLRESSRLNSRVLYKLADEIKSGKKSGKFIMGQLDYGNENWRNAFGGIWINWALRNPIIDIWITNTYKWTPGEARVTQCVHQAMVRAEKYGAKPFPFEGTKHSISIRDIDNLPPQISKQLSSGLW